MRSMVMARSAWLAIMLAVIPALTVAQAVDSGALMRQQNPSPEQEPGRTQALRRNRELTLQVQEEGKASQAVPSRESKGGETLFVSRFLLTKPSPLISEANLNERLSEFVGRDDSLEDLDRATQRVADMLKEQGYHFARVRIPQQEVVDGKVALDVAPGKLSKVRARGLSRLSEERAQAVVSSAITSEEGLNLAEVERGLLLLNELPGVRGTGLVLPGEEPGTLELALDLREDSLTGGWASVDNYGSRSTGNLRGAADLRLNNPSGRGDAAEFYGAGSDDTLSATVSYAMPLGVQGLRLRLAGSYMRYKLGQDFDALDSKGRSRWLSAGISNPVLRSRKANLSITSTFEYKKLEDRALDVSISDRYSTALSLGLRGNYAWDGGLRALDYGATVTGGHLHRENNFVDWLIDALTRRTDGNYSILRITGGWLQNLTPRWSLSASTELQFTNSNLDSSEKIYLGGPRGVRAYPIEEAGGDQGQTMVLEARWFAGQFPQLGGQAWTLFGLFDAGHITRNRQTWNGWNAANPAMRNSYWLKGGGVGARAQIGGHGQLELVGARRIGGNPGADLAGLDADGRSSKNRLWMNASVSF